MERSFEKEKGLIDPAFTEEYLRLLVDNRRFETVWKVFNNLSQDLRQNERIAVLAGQAAIEIGEYTFVQTLFEKELVFIKEGETTISDLWYRLQAINMAKAQDIPYTERLLHEALKTLTPPKEIDFRMYDAALQL
jgi:predicted helicase